MYHKINIIIFIIIICLSSSVFSQNNSNSLYFWRLHSYSGELRLNGSYREQERLGLSIAELEKSGFLSGGLLLNVNSSFVNQNFLLLNVEGGYMPETSRHNFIVIPDKSEVTTTKKLGFSASFFKNKIINLGLLGDYNQSYSSRENITDIKSTNRHWGVILNLNNKIIPVTIDFHSRLWEQQEMQTGRIYKLNQNVFGARASRSFTKHDKNDLRYSRDESVSTNQNLFKVENTTDNIDFNSNVFLGHKQNYNLNTIASYFNQRGVTKFIRIQAGESIYLRLPKNFSLMGNYNYFNFNQNVNTMQQHSINSSFEHKLYKSLVTRINYDFNSINHSVYKESDSKYGAELSYTKKIPTKGQLLITYKYDRYHKNYDSDPVDLNVVNEQYTIDDSKIILLKLSDINISTIVVKDATGTIIYQSGIDYNLIQQGRFIEIKRIPSGAIANLSSILLDYTAIQPGAYKYDANIHLFTTSIYLFKNILSFSYRFSTQGYADLETTELVTLNYFTQHLVSCRIDFGFINAGAEYEDYQSTILPYRMMRYYLNFQRNIGKKVSLMLDGSYQKYEMLDGPEVTNQQYINATGKIVYTFLKQTNFSIDANYRKQTGRGLDLDLLIARAEITSNINRLYLSIGAELYRRNYVGEQINFKGAYFKIARTF